MAKAATKFKRWVNTAINHPGHPYRFKKILGNPPGLCQDSLRFWVEVCGDQDSVWVEICVKEVRIYDKRPLSTLDLHSPSRRRRGAVLERWWQELLAQLREALATRYQVA